jgi:hypothetical protein
MHCSQQSFEKYLRKCALSALLSGQGIDDFVAQYKAGYQPAARAVYQQVAERKGKA